MTRVMSNEELQEFAEQNWARVKPEKRKLCVEHLRKVLSGDYQDYIANSFKDGFDPFFHFSGGMAVRNTLREVMKDDELPPVKYPYEGDPEYGGSEFRIWDDFYMAALRQAVMPKDGEE